ncbi:MAG: hypothetical protein WKG32_15795 [Gemmatimonadaceae bacterium]
MSLPTRAILAAALGAALRSKGGRRPARGLARRFHRDPTGKVVAFDYSNPVVGDLRFTRVIDRTGRR